MQPTIPFTNQEYQQIQNIINQTFNHPNLQDESNDILEINTNMLIKSEDAYRFGKTFSLYKLDKDTYVYQLKDEDCNAVYFQIESKFENILKHLKNTIEADVECIEQQL